MIQYKDMIEKAEAKRQAIIAETEDWKLNSPEGYTWHGKLNNYHAYLPSDFYSDRGGRQIAIHVIRIGIMDKVNDDTFSQDDTARSHHSELFMSQTPREFFNAIDQVIDSLPDVSLDVINKLQRDHYEIPGIRMYQNMPSEEEQKVKEKIDRSMEAIRALYEYTLPVYIDLRVMGYSHFDLTG